MAKTVLHEDQHGQQAEDAKAGAKQSQRDFQHQTKRKFALLEQEQQETHIIMIHQFLHEEEGQTLVEYGLLISLIALVVIGVLTLLGSKIKNTFNKASDSMNTAT